jgi:ATP-dependent Clp protease ATP-binding subunit ClpC
MEKHSVARLIGAPPGYVGYDSGGLLTDRVRRHPYSVILFDEIEKAHPDVLHILLQILEDGRLTDSTGRKADFSSAVIMMTSNLLSSEESGGLTLGFTSAPSVTARDPENDPTLRQHLSPELLGRIDEIIRFAPLNGETLERIAARMLNDLRERVSLAGITLRTASDIPALLARLCVTEHKGLGARPLRSEIRRLIEDPLAELFTSAHRPESGVFEVLAQENTVRVVFDPTPTDAPRNAADAQRL